MIKVYVFTLVSAIFLSCDWGSATDSPQSAELPQEETPPAEAPPGTPDEGDPGTIPPEEETPQNQDQHPPVLISWGYNSQGIYCFEFDEPLEVQQDSWQIEPAGSLELSVTDCQLELHWQDPPEPAREYQLSLTVEDSAGNSNWFILPFWTRNPQGAELLLNEANPKGSGNNPDTLEFLCTKTGSLRNMTFYLGTPRENKGFFRFPDLNVTEGDFILLHCKPQGIPEEVNETTDQGESGGLLASETAWDFWVSEDLSVPGTNGVLSLYSLPLDGVLQDCLIYTNRSDNTSEENLGWTSVVWNQIITLPEGAWQGLSDGLLPSEAVWGDHSTGTRSLCRSSTSEDSNQPSDWHTVPTSGSTFGGANSDECHSP